MDSTNSENKQFQSLLLKLHTCKHSSMVEYLAQDIIRKTIAAIFIALFIWYGYPHKISGRV